LPDVVLFNVVQEADVRRSGAASMTSIPKPTILLILIPLLVAGCTNLWQTMSGNTRRGVSSSLVDYLYPGGEEPPPYSESVPQLNVPLRVGLAFVPGTVQADVPVLSETKKAELLQDVRAHFLDRNYIAEIEIIPETYMRTGRGFTSLDQISRIYNLDVMALVSYDQVVASEDTTASFLYWTIIGAYMIEGSKNDVQTFVDTAVFDISTRRLLFRAPGSDQYASKSTLIKAPEELRETRAASFSRAMTEMTDNLSIELDKFEFRIKEDPTVAQVTPQAGYGGGAISAYLLLLLAAVRVYRRQHG
jgi:rhombotail lipoprotein